MGLFGALFAGVSGLDSQSNSIGIISNNISNVNTVGYKQSVGGFGTLVVPSGTTTFSPGGVIGQTQSLINQQGLVQGTSSATDAAITGNGFFVVNTKADGTGAQLLTRAGSFTQDANGNFINSEGYFLQGVSLAGLTTALTSINQNQLTTVNINQNATGSANATTQLTLAANFNAGETPILGPGEKVTLAGDGTNNANTGADIIIPTLAASGGNGLKQGDSFSVTSLGANSTSVFTYGGITYGRSAESDIDTAAANANSGTQDAAAGAGGTLLDSETGIGITVNSNGTVTIPISELNATYAGQYQQGSSVSISGVAANIGSMTPAQLNGEWSITTNNGTNLTLTNSNLPTSGFTTGTGNVTFSNRTYPFTGNILNATSATSDFLAGIDGPTTFAAGALSFQITTNGTSSSTSTFTYNAQPNTGSGQFNSLTTLAAAINSSSNGTLTASIANNQIYISATNANEGLTFTNENAAGTAGLPGINWTQELGLPSTVAAATTGVNRFNTLNGLANLINGNSAISTNLIATVNNATSSGATLNLNEADPTSGITFTDGNTATSTANTGASLLKAFGFVSSSGSTLGSGNLVTGSSPPEYTVSLGATYNADSSTTDMSSGVVTPQFTKDITIYDALGNAHTIALNVAKLGVNTWAVELTAVPASSVVSTNNDGQIASGIVSFTNSGTFSQVQKGNLSSGSITVNWTQTGPNAVGAAPNQIKLDLTGLIQSAGSFNVTNAQQNGSPTGQLTGVSINNQGFVVETFSNGQTKEAYQIPLANVSNPDGLQGVSGNAYEGTLASGPVSYNIVGQGGTGAITSSALENSNVDLSTQLTNLIIAQQAYGANSKLLTVADTLLQQLDQIIQ